MATSTTNLGLTKPSVNDAADIGVLNSNFDKIDTKCNPALFAPSGYGLGTYAQLLTADHNLNNPLRTGLYRWGSSVPVNAPSPIGYAVMLHIARTDGDSIQKVWHLGTHPGVQISCERYLSDNKGEWEWTNPPMTVGQEYRTTKRWKGVPVYTRLFEYGALPNNTQAGVALGVTDAEHITHIIGRYASSGGNTTSYPPPGAQVNAWGNNIYINATGDLSSWSAQFTIEYIKT
jgi:hypothetical protein